MSNDTALNNKGTSGTGNWQYNLLRGIQAMVNNTDTVENILSSILATLGATKDYEAKFVVDSNNVVWLEVRNRDELSGTWSTVEYYAPGSNTPGTPSAPIVYTDPTSLLTNLYTVSSSTRLPGFIRTSAAGTVAQAPLSVSVANVGVANGSVLGSTIKVGEVLNFDAGGLSNKYGAGTFSYDGSGTELLIIYTY